MGSDRLPASSLAGGSLALLCLLGGCEPVVTIVAGVDTQAGGSPGVGGTGGAEADSSGGDGGGGMGGSGPFGLDFEAEMGTLAGEFSVSTVDGFQVVSANAAAQAADSPGDARATYDFEVLEAGSYVIWGRVHGPAVSANRFWYRVDGGSWYLWRISTGSEWFWDDLHDNFEYGMPVVFDLDVGSHRLELANAVVGSEVDKFSVRLAGEDGPESEVTCDPPHSILADGMCIRSCGSYGNVTCGEMVCEGRPEVVAYDCALCCLLD